MTIENQKYITFGKRAIKKRKDEVESSGRVSFVKFCCATQIKFFNMDQQTKKNW